MTVKRTESELETLEKHRVSLNNAEKQPEIATVMAEFGYDNAAIAVGKSLFTETRSVFDANKTEDDETRASRKQFDILNDDLHNTYAMHRKKAKIIFKKDGLTKDKLSVSGSIPDAYIRWLETVKKFYSVALSDTEIQDKLLRLKISADDLNAANAMISDLEAARLDYLREKGESQDATKAKDAALAKLDDWMAEFKAAARIALEDKPQLLEALGIFVRS